MFHRMIRLESIIIGDQKNTIRFVRVYWRIRTIMVSETKLGRRPGARLGSLRT